MSAVGLREWTEADYDRAAQEYQAQLTLEHYMESTPQSMQRTITLASLSLVVAQVANFHLFNELLVQFVYQGQLRQVVPDNMVVFAALTERDRSSFAPDLEGTVPFWVLEYVSPRSQRKDYLDNMLTYEQQLRVPYYLVFDPDRQDLRLFKLNGEHYRCQASTEGRFAIAELEIEVGLLGRWVRFWFRGRLLELPAELDARLRAAEQDVAKGLRLLRGVVEEKALALGRQDVVERLALVRNMDEMERLLDEVGG